MTIAKIVYDELSEKEKAKVDKLIHVLDPFYPNMNTFILNSQKFGHYDL
jgi:hypothetical protein